MLTDLQASKLRKLRKLKEIVDFTIAAQEVLVQPEPQVPEPVDLAGFRTAVRNQVLAGSGVKAEWLGTLSTPPTLGAADVQALGLTAAVATLVTGCRDELRAAALVLKVQP